MHLSTILVTGHGSSYPAAVALPDSSRSVPLAHLEIFGQSVLERTVARLQKAGVGAITVVASGRRPIPRKRGLTVLVGESWEERWSQAERAFQKYVRHGSRTVLLGELGSYVEFDLDAALQFHESRKRPLTPLYDHRGPVNYWVVDTTRVSSIRDVSSRVSDEQAGGIRCRYVNRLADARDLRQLVIDAFLGRTSITPAGCEIKPGVWVDEEARVHKSARLVAPVYVGRHSVVRPAAVITRFSDLESHCHVGANSVVTDATILPHTRIGRGLDVSDAVVDGSQWVDISRNVTVNVADPRLIADATTQLHFPSHRVEGEAPDFGTAPPDLDYSQYLSRAAGRLLEVFRGEV